jgi:ATP-dependent DNA ligase
MVDALAGLPGVCSLVIDGELVACDAAGLPNFCALQFRRHDRGLCVWAFDLLHHNGCDLRELHVLERKARQIFQPNSASGALLTWLLWV